MARLLIRMIYMYRWIISPLFPPRCRFEPTCSRYAIHAFEIHGLLKGFWLTIQRLARCHPYEKIVRQLGPTFGYDPVPLEKQKPANHDAEKASSSTSF